MSRLLLFSIVFIEGFCSLGAEVIALRQIIPHLGSSIVVTAPTIGFFLLALALGYHAGAKIDEGYIEVVAKNFLLAALLVGIGLAGIGVDLLFTALRPPELAYLLLVAGVLCPIAWLLGQTVPILTNLLLRERAGEASGEALYYSTLGSFLGSLSLSLLVMQWLGVSAAVALCALLLVIGYTLLRGPGWRTAVISLGVASLTGVANAWLRPEIETAYASYLVLPVQYEGAINGRALKNNSSFASLIDDSEPPLYARYIRHIRSLLLDELGFRERRILVLGAGGFTLSHREPSNHYTYVDIDPAVRGIAEKHFLGEAARGEFIADDARRFVIRSEQRFAAAIVRLWLALLDPRPSGHSRILAGDAAGAGTRGIADCQPDPRQRTRHTLLAQSAGDHRERLWSLRRRGPAEKTGAGQCGGHLPQWSTRRAGQPVHRRTQQRRLRSRAFTLSVACRCLARPAQQSADRHTAPVSARRPQGY